jgi:hypothetical protein
MPWAAVGLGPQGPLRETLRRLESFVLWSRMPSTAQILVRIGSLLLYLVQGTVVHAQETEDITHGRPDVSDLLALHACRDTSCMSVYLRPMGYKPEKVLGSQNYFWYRIQQGTQRYGTQLDEHTRLVLITDDHFKLDSVGFHAEDPWRTTFITDDPAYVKQLRSHLNALGWQSYRYRAHVHSYSLTSYPGLSIRMERAVVLFSSKRPSKATYWKVSIYRLANLPID